MFTVIIPWICTITFIMGLDTSKCKDEIKESAKYVTSCPESEKSWNDKEMEKNCRMQTPSCPPENPPVYHCVLDESKEPIEFCGPSRVLLGYCPQYVVNEGRLQDDYTMICTGFKIACPPRYRSTKAYQYPQCYKVLVVLDASEAKGRHANSVVHSSPATDVNISMATKQSNSSIRDVRISIFGVLSCLLLILFVIGLIKLIVPWCKKRCQKKKTREECMDEETGLLNLRPVAEDGTKPNLGAFQDILYPFKDAEEILQNYQRILFIQTPDNTESLAYELHMLLDHASHGWSVKFVKSPKDLMSFPESLENVVFFIQGLVNDDSCIREWKEAIDIMDTWYKDISVNEKARLIMDIQTESQGDINDSLAKCFGPKNIYFLPSKLSDDCKKAVLDEYMFYVYFSYMILAFYVNFTIALILPAFLLCKYSNKNVRGS